MAWEKKDHRRIIHYPGSMEVEEYVYTPGLHGKELGEALVKGRIVAMKCPDGLYFPPRTYCRDGTEASLADIGDREWRVISYTIIYEDLDGNRLEEPVVIGIVSPEGVKGGLIHRIKEEPKRIRIGMKVKPVLKPPGERRGTIEDIAYFERSENPNSP